MKSLLYKFIHILIIYTFITIPQQTFARDWIPNQIGAFLSSKIARSIPDIESSAYYAKYAYNRNTESNGLALVALEALIANGQINEAIEIGTKIASNKPEISLAQYTLALKKIKADNYVDVSEIFKNITPTGIDNYILPILQAWADAKNNINPEGLQIIAQQADKGILAPIYGFHTALINEYLGNDNAASLNYQNVVNRANTANAIVFIKAALFFEKIGENNLKTETLNKLERLDPYSNELNIFLNEKSLKSYNIITSPKEGIAEILLNSAELLYNEELYVQALTYAQMAKYLNNKSDEPNYLLGRIFKSINNENRALNYFKQVSDDSFVSHDAKIAVADLLYNFDGLTSAVSYLKDLESKHTNNINFPRKIAELNYKAENFNESALLYENIINNLGTIEFKHWPLLYSCGISLERSNNWNKAEKYFLLALEHVPDNPQVLNYLGYSWIDQGINIDRALSMIQKAVDQRPNDGYIIDSLGWAYYQLGDYEKAVFYLERASEILSDSIIIDHLGDALFHSGRKIEAMFQWERALKFDPSEDLRKTIEDKINKITTPKEGVNAGSKPI